MQNTNEQPTTPVTNPVKKDTETTGKPAGLGEAFAPPKTDRYMAAFLRGKRMAA